MTSVVNGPVSEVISPPVAPTLSQSSPEAVEALNSAVSDPPPSLLTVKLAVWGANPSWVTKLTPPGTTLGDAGVEPGTRCNVTATNCGLLLDPEPSMGSRAWYTPELSAKPSGPFTDSVTVDGIPNTIPEVPLKGETFSHEGSSLDGIDQFSVSMPRL